MESKNITISEEDLENLKHCLDRTKKIWESHIDLWPFTIMSIVKRWEESKNG